MELILEEKKHLTFIQKPKLSKNMQFDAVADINMAKRKDELLIAVNQRDHNESKAEYLHNTISPNNLS